MTNEMTAEEAIRWLDAIKKYYIHGGDEAYDKKRMKAIDKAIQALEQQPSEDCISREAVIRLVEQYPNIIGNRCSGLIADIKHLPSVKPQPSEEDFVKHKKEVLERIAKREREIDKYIKELEALEQQPCEDCISRQKALDCFEQTNTRQGAKYAIETLPSVTPQYTDEEIDKAQAVEQAYVDKMVELAVEESRREWLNSFDTSSATKCFEAVNLLKQRLEG